MYSQFRAQYPTASLTSDLLVAEPSHYVVQASVKIGGAALATGLSSASTVEAAEDQARARALMILGIPTPGLSSANLQVLEDPSHELPPGAPAQLNPAMQPELESEMIPDSEETEWNWPQPAEDESEAILPKPYFAEDDFDQEPPGLDMEPSPPKGRRKSPSKTPKRGRAKSANPEPPQPIDLSDIIAQTDIELKRLGWNHVKGRKFLEHTYNKRSRQQLTDSELLEFLEYLKVQSAAQDPPF